MIRILSTLLLLGLAVPPAPGQAAKEPPIPVVKVPLAGSPPTTQRALKYALLPSYVDLVQGNAAPQWVRAGLIALESGRKITPEESAWGSSEVPLDKLPRDRVRRFLEANREALKQADLAARYDRCDWDHRPTTLQDLNLPLVEIQQFRQLANLLAIRCRLEMAEGKFDKAACSLQTGLALGREVADGQLLIENLVGVAITAIMLGRVEEWLALPGAPELFWPLTALPNPLVDCRRAIKYEAGTVYRSFPQLRSLAREPLTAEESNRIANEVSRFLTPLVGDKGPPQWQVKLGMAALAAQAYPQAKQYLLQRGRTAEQVDAMPVLQVVWIYVVEQYDETWDEVLKWVQLPYWQAQPGLEEVHRKIVAARSTTFNALIGLLMPAFTKVQQANIRSQRQVAALRCACAIQLHAARHGGKPPAELKEITEIPLPIDPVTGRGFDEMYKVTGGKAVLEVPPLKNQPAVTGRRFEFVETDKGQEKQP
jgi:hypothetical protein